MRIKTALVLGVAAVSVALLSRGKTSQVQLEIPGSLSKEVEIKGDKNKTSLHSLYVNPNKPLYGLYVRPETSASGLYIKPQSTSGAITQEYEFKLKEVRPGWFQIYDLQGNVVGPELHARH